MTTIFTWRGAFTNAEVNALHAEAFRTRLFDESEWNWVEHVDFDEHLRPFYLGACGFAPTSAGLIVLDAPG